MYDVRRRKNEVGILELRVTFIWVGWSGGGLNKSVAGPDLLQLSIRFHSVPFG